MLCPLRARLWLVVGYGIRVSRVARPVTGLCSVLSMRRNAQMTRLVLRAALLAIRLECVPRTVGGEYILLTSDLLILSYFTRVRLISCYVTARFPLGIIRVWLCRMLGGSLPQASAHKVELARQVRMLVWWVLQFLFLCLVV